MSPAARYCNNPFPFLHMPLVPSAWDRRLQVSRIPRMLERLGPAAAPVKHQLCAAPRTRLAAARQRAPGSCRSSAGAPPAGRAGTRRRPGCWCRSPSPTTPAAAGPWTCAVRSGLFEVAAPAPGGPPGCQPRLPAHGGAARRLKARRLPRACRQVHRRRLPARTHMASATCVLLQRRCQEPTADCQAVPLAINRSGAVRLRTIACRSAAPSAVVHSWTRHRPVVSMARTV